MANVPFGSCLGLMVYGNTFQQQLLYHLTEVLVVLSRQPIFNAARLIGLQRMR